MGLDNDIQLAEFLVELGATQHASDDADPRRLSFAAKVQAEVDAEVRRSRQINFIVIIIS